MTLLIDRGFVRTSAGLIHYRCSGDDAGRPPLVMLHGGPGSSASLVPLIVALAAGRRVIAPDTPGCGCSDPLPGAEPTIVRFADVLAELLDGLGIAQADVYGYHTGAQIACELAIAAPARVRRAVFDGAALFAPALRQEFLERYAPPIEPAADGSHLTRVWAFASALTRYFPHYARDEAHRTTPGIVLPPGTVTTIAAEVLQVWPTWHLAYRAAFRHDLAARLPLVAAPVLVLRTEGDPLADYAETAAGLLSLGRLADTTRDGKERIIADFLAA